jgi:hypothetical protein
MTTEFPYDVFLRATNQADKTRVRRLAERLRAAGLRQRNFGFGISNFGFPPQAAWVGLDRSAGLFRDPANAGRRLIPLLLADCKLPDSLWWPAPTVESPSTANSVLTRHYER